VTGSLPTPHGGARQPANRDFSEVIRGTAGTPTATGLGAVLGVRGQAKQGPAFHSGETASGDNKAPSSLRSDGSLHRTVCTFITRTDS
ncbi:MAG TPA: hypothetical protein VHI52_03455, partial [Verrucomicrobiae bacterium]|nr:hypothetical protein [Verrucomicrobiae bacterium]